jgi:hypothetical protein
MILLFVNYKKINRWLDGHGDKLKLEEGYTKIKQLQNQNKQPTNDLQSTRS